jgi:hypothetical protein
LSTVETHPTREPAAPATANAPTGETPLMMGIGEPGRIVVSWTAAGGVLLGGFGAVFVNWGLEVTATEQLLASGGLFLVGSLLGFLHGLTLGYFGRPPGMSARRSARLLALSAVYALPTIALVPILAGWIALTPLVVSLGRTLPMAAMGLAWLGGAWVLWLAVSRGAQGLRWAFDRWPQRVPATALVGALFVANLVTFQAQRLDAVGLQVRVGLIGVIVIAGGLTVWLAGPMVTAGFWLQDRLREPDARAWGGMLVSVLAGLAVGAALAALVLPFFEPPLRVAAPVAAQTPAMALAIAASQALLEEVVLRLFLLTVAAWLLLRYAGASRLAAIAGSIAAGAVAQLFLYLPVALDIGFPSTGWTLWYLFLVALLPAVVFGGLFWKRGFAAVLVAGVTRMILIALLVG